MAIVTPALLTNLMTGFRSDFQTAYSAMQAQTQFAKIATTVPSSSKSNTYGWLGQFPKFREWVGDRTVKDMEASAYQILNKSYESTVGVARTDIEDDNIGVYRPLMSEMGRAAASFPDELVFALLAAGNATACYDGQFFFDTDHPVYPNTDGTGAVATVSNNDVPGASPGAAWYLLDASRVLKPLIYQERKAANFQAMTNEQDESVFMSNLYRYGVDTRCNVGYGFWQMAYRSQQPLDATHYASARAAMMGFKADGGRPLGITPTILVVPPSLEGAARALVTKDASQGNPWYGTAEVLVSPWLS